MFLFALPGFVMTTFYACLSIIMIGFTVFVLFLFGLGIVHAYRSYVSLK